MSASNHLSKLFSLFSKFFKIGLRLTLTFAIIPLILLPVGQREALAFDGSDEKTSPEEISINPTTLRQQLLKTNLTLAQQIINIKEDKERFLKERDNLIPSFSISAASPTFFLSAITFLVPFLSPSNWFNYKAEKYNFEAEKLGFQIFELNLFSSAMSLYVTAYIDHQVQLLYLSEANDLQKYYNDFVPQKKYGTISDEILKTYEGKADAAKGAASQASQNSSEEIEALRDLLDLPSTAKINLEDPKISASPWEKKSIEEAKNYTFEIAPERLQIEALIQAARKRESSAKFSFIDAGTYGSSTSAPGAPMSGLYLGGTINLGFGLFHTINLAKDETTQTGLLTEVFKESNQQAVTNALKGAAFAIESYNEFAASEAAFRETFAVSAENYKNGAFYLGDLLYSRINIVNYAVDRIKAQLNLYLQRITLERAFLTDEFAQIKGCRVADTSKSKKTSLEELCRQDGLQ